MAGMKPRHAAALALVGWYLMVPPPDNLTAPISAWEVAASYDTGKHCSLEQQRFFDKAIKQRNLNLGKLERGDASCRMYRDR